MGSGAEKKGVRAGARIHPFKPRQPRRDAGDLHFALRVDNFQHLLAAYGSTIAQRVMTEVNRTLADLFGDGGLVMRDGANLISVLVWDAALVGEGPLHDACANFLQVLLERMATAPIHVGRDVLYVALSGAWSLPAAEDQKEAAKGQKDAEQVKSGGAAAALARIPFSGDPPVADDGWVRRYRCDMADTVDLFDMLANERVVLAWQSVRRTEGLRAILYRECLLRAADGREDYFAPARLVPSLERLGLVRALDRYVLGRVLDELEASPVVSLGVNISAHSAVLDGWWVEIVKRLRRRPDVASRLVLEITETAKIPFIAEAASFAARMRSFGCRIALDDFGSGHASIRQLLALKPDIVKVSAFFLGRAELSDKDRAAFQHIVGLAKALAPVVVVDGAKSEALFRIAEAAGSPWQQGYYLDRPTTFRTWLTSEDLARITELERLRARFEDVATDPQSQEASS